MTIANNIKQELQIRAAAAKSDFENNALPIFLGKHPDLDQDLLAIIALDFFDIFCELNQVRQAAESHGRDWNGKRLKEELIQDTNEQWQYYAAFFYHRLTADSALSPTYTPEEIENLELRMSCQKEETMGLSHDKAYAVLGSLIGGCVKTMKEHFEEEVIHTNRPIPDLNRDKPEKLVSNLSFWDEPSSPQTR